MNKTEVLAIFDRDQRRDSVSQESLREVTPQVMRHVPRHDDARWGWIVYSQLTVADADAADLISIYCAYVDQSPVSTAWIRFHPGTQFASLWGGATVALFRKRGLYTALLAVRAAEARDKGYRFLTVDASEMSRPILEKHGFVKIATTAPYKYRIRNGAV